MTDLVAWLLVAAVLALIGWGMFALNRRAARTRATAARGWLPVALAMPPAVVYGAMILRFLVEVQIDPTSNNLWPLMVVMLLVCWAGYILALRLLLGIAGYFTANRV